MTTSNPGSDFVPFRDVCPGLQTRWYHCLYCHAWRNIVSFCRFLMWSAAHELLSVLINFYFACAFHRVLRDLRFFGQNVLTGSEWSHRVRMI